MPSYRRCRIPNGDPVFASHRANRDAFIARRGLIGTDGVSTFSMRIDHHTDFIATSGILAAHRDYGVPASWAHYSRQQSVANHTRSWESIQDIAFGYGLEPFCHSATHTDRPDYAGYVDETSTAVAELRASLPGCPVESFVIPGRPVLYGTDGAWGGFMAATRKQFTDLPAGRLVLENFGASTGSIGSQYWTLDGKPALGMSKSTIDTRDAAWVINQITYAQNNGLGVSFMIHPNKVNEAGFITTADYRAIMAHVAAERDAGRLVPLTLSGMACADINASQRSDVVTNGGFDVDLVGWDNTGGVWDQMDYAAQNLTDVASTSTSVNDQWLSQTVQIPEALRGSVFEFSLDAWHYSGTGGTDGTVRVYISGGTVSRPIGPIPRALTTPTRIVTTHLLDKRASSFGIFIAKEGAGGRLSIKNVRLRTV